MMFSLKKVDNLRAREWEQEEKETTNSEPRSADLADRWFELSPKILRYADLMQIFRVIP